MTKRCCHGFRCVHVAALRGDNHRRTATLRSQKHGERAELWIQGAGRGKRSCPEACGGCRACVRGRVDGLAGAAVVGFVLGVGLTDSRTSIYSLNPALFAAIPRGRRSSDDHVPAGGAERRGAGAAVPGSSGRQHDGDHVPCGGGAGKHHPGALPPSRLGSPGSWLGFGFGLGLGLA